MRVLVLGGYGLIGGHVLRRLREDGHEVSGLGRDVARARRAMPSVHWIGADLARLTTPQAWAPILAQSRPEAIVNCAGVLQDGARDKVEAVQHDAMLALYGAAEAAGVRRLVQISAVRASPDSDTAFMRSKGRADAALRQTPLEWTILRPGLVLAPQAYGGTALLRGLAAVPLVQPVVHADRPVQTVSVNDVAEAVALVLAGRVVTHAIYDLVEETPHSLREVVAALRSWLGVPHAPEVVAPLPLVTAASYLADVLGWLGWRSPLRSTALVEVAAGITGDPGPWKAQTGRHLSPLASTLEHLPSTVQERWFARLFLLNPLVVGGLAMLWLLSGLIGLWEIEAASVVLTSRGVSVGVARLVVLTGALVDIALGLAILWRPWLSRAALGMIVVTLAYLFGATLLAPDLWGDPLGPLIKTLPAMLLAAVALALEEER